MTNRFALFLLAAVLATLMAAMPAQSDDRTPGPARADTECYHGPDLVDCAVDQGIDQARSDDQCWYGPDMVGCARDEPTAHAMAGTTSVQ